jgi:hypothetical protein
MPVARRAVSAAVLLLACVVAPEAAPQLTADTTLVVWVDAGNGSDSPGRWVMGLPYNTLNYALDQVWDILHPTSGRRPGNPIEIRIAATSEPISPVVSGGHEADGWSPGPGMRAGKPLPLRMINGVSIVGASPTVRAVIKMNDSYVMPQGHQAAVIAASSCRLENLDIDGRNFISSGSFAYRGVWVGAVTDFELINCDVHDWHDQLWLEPAEGKTSRVAAYGCTFSGSWPVLPAPSEGHALVRVADTGTVDLLIDGCLLRNSHDGLEVAATFDAPHFVHVRHSLFEDCENSLELSGTGASVILVEDTVFRNGGPRPGGNGGLGGVGGRGTADIDCTIRRCTFTDNGVSVHWEMTMPQAVLDMGRDDDPGLNGFCFTTEKCDPHNVLRVAIEQISEPGNVVLAAGNFWLPANQGASGTIGVPVTGYANRFFTQGMVVGPVNIMTCPPQCPKGPPLAHEGCESPLTPRNYSIKAGVAIDFGTQLPPVGGFLPPPCEECDCAR